VKKLTKHVKKLILPFATSAKDRYVPFTKDMEMAAIVYLTERERKKGEGRVLKKTREKIGFIAETCYPIWLIPWKGKTLIFDGLEFSNPSISYDMIPDATTFDNDLQASSKSRQAYDAALVENVSYFQNFSGKEEIIIEGLITNPEFVQDLMNYLQDAEDIEKSTTKKAILSPRLDASEVSASINKLSDLRGRIETEVRNLCKSMKGLSKGTKVQVRALQAEMKETLKEFDKKMKDVKPKVMKKIAKIKEKRDEEVTNISKKHDKVLRALHKNRITIERTLERLTTEIERYESDIKKCRDQKDEAGEVQITEKLGVAKKKIPELNKEIKEIDREIENVDGIKKVEVSKARTKPDDQIEEAMMSIRDIEAAKEARIRLQQQELSDIEEKTADIIKQIDTMIKAKEAALNELDSIGAKDRRRKQAIAYLPLYFVCYETDVEKRYVVYPPSHVGSLGIKTKLKGVFGAGKMKSFLQPRSQAIATLLDQLVYLTKENPVFETEINEAGNKANILREADSQAYIQKGFTELKNEGWISETEVQELNQSMKE
jgi:copper chaperone CopZ